MPRRDSGLVTRLHFVSGTGQPSFKFSASVPPGAAYPAITHALDQDPGQIIPTPHTRLAGVALHQKGLTMIEFLLGLSFWPVALIIVWLFVVSVSTAGEQVFVAFLATVIAMAIAYFAFGANLLAYVASNPLSTLVLAVMYFVMGMAWSIYRWWDRVSEKSIILAGMSPDDGQRKYVRQEIDPESRDARQSIKTWIVLWPFSMLGHLFGDLLLRLADKLYEMTLGAYKRITDRHLPPDMRD